MTHRLAPPQVTTFWLLLALCACEHEPSTPPKAQRAWSELAVTMSRELREAAGLALAEGRHEDAREAVERCYEERFEPPEQNMEDAIRDAISPARASTIEASFEDLERSLASPGPAGEALARLTRLERQLTEAAAALDQKRVPIGPRSEAAD
jgi:hypothetical protein